MVAVRKVLIGARRRIASPERWTRKRMARDGLRNPTDPDSPSARCWCSLGSLTLSVKSLPLDEQDKVYDKAWGRLSVAAAVVMGESIRTAEPTLLEIVRVNDFLAHADVLKMFDLAIAEAE